MEIWFGIANGQISSIFDGVICPQHYNGGLLSFEGFIDKGDNYDFYLLSCTHQTPSHQIFMKRKGGGVVGSNF